MEHNNIQDYHKRINELKSAGGTQKETSIRKAFLEMVGKYAKERYLTIVDELQQCGTRNRPDAALQSSMGLNFGYIENKDIFDNFELEIEKKIAKGYDLTNTLFENSQWLVLYQDKEVVEKIQIDNQTDFDRAIKRFVAYEPVFVGEFKEALEKFKENIPELSDVLHDLIQKQYRVNKEFQKEVGIFLEDCREAINSELIEQDINNMIVQHILTQDIFDSIFDDQAFHKYNSIAKSIDKITKTFFTKEKEMELTRSIRGYYQTIINTAKAIVDHRQKQSFLKTIYQEFYKAYNPSKADRQGIEYTPIEVVGFMIQMTDLLLCRHFSGQRLQDKNVEILDPCTGTGIFISELLYEIAHNQNFDYKFENELFCNEIDILPYYIANLNIEYIRAQLKKDYKEFKNIVLVDTLKNTAALQYFGAETNKSVGLFSSQHRDAFNENNEKIKKQNEAKLKVIIGNPPYNANQQNENDNNKNFSYPHIDKRIKETYIAKSTAQKTKQLDMYKRFIRWASDRMDEQKGGIIAFITNNAYLDAKQDDGFRACVREEFDHAYFVNLKGDVRRNPKISGTKHNVFGIQTGVGIMFLIKNGDNPKSCDIKYTEVDDYATKEDKLDFLNKLRIKISGNINLRTYNEIAGKFERITPNNRNQWLGMADNDWQTLLPLIDKKMKTAKTEALATTGNVNAIFKIYSLGVATNRDKWVYDVNEANLQKKIKKFIEVYDQELKRNNDEIDRLKEIKQAKGTKHNADTLSEYYMEHRKWEYQLDPKIKWSRDLKDDLRRKLKLKFDKSNIRDAMYRPFCKKYLYYSHGLNDLTGHFNKIFPQGVGGKRGSKPTNQRVICVVDRADKFTSIITDRIPSLDTITHTQCIPLQVFDEGAKIPNLTSWGRQKFVSCYGSVSDEDIFYYCYAVLNRTDYKEKYKANLKVDLPRIPLLDDFAGLTKLGRQLADLHVDYELAPRYGLELFKIPRKAIPEANKVALKRDFKPRIYLRADKLKGKIVLDDYHILRGIPLQAFDYKIGNKSPIEWVCSENCFYTKYDLKSENEAFLAEMDDYNWEDEKLRLVELIERLVSVSLETINLLNQINKLGN